MTWIILGLLAAAVVGWYLFRPVSDERLRRSEAKARQQRLEQRLVRTPADMEGLGDVRGLTLRVPDLKKACARARQDNGTTFLTYDAPPIPLPGCDVAECDCAYFAVPGRRSGKDRRSGVERRTSVRFDPDKKDRRSGKDRRRGGTDPWSGRS